MKVLMKTMTTILITLVAALALAYLTLNWLACQVLGGRGGVHPMVPDIIKTGEPTTVVLRAFATDVGCSWTPIRKRFTDVQVYYRLYGESEWQGPLKPNGYILDKDGQRLDFRWFIPSYPPGTTGELEVTFKHTFDGRPREAPTRRAKLTNAPIWAIWVTQIYEGKESKSATPGKTFLSYAECEKGIKKHLDYIEHGGFAKRVGPNEFRWLLPTPQDKRTERWECKEVPPS
ncbi:MAG: hypothetical protein WCH75_17585 [Candidatus Binatia bacterium]